MTHCSFLFSTFYFYFLYNLTNFYNGFVSQPGWQTLARKLNSNEAFNPTEGFQVDVAIVNTILMVTMIVMKSMQGYRTAVWTV